MSQSQKRPTGVVTVNVALGALRGKKSKTVTGNPIVSFQGIPYAKPPVGPLRFKPPQEEDSCWSGIRDALQEGPVCFHYDILKKDFVGGEDCLYLNVYTPKLPVEKSEALQPVMVWIHGGGFTHGSGNADFYGPDYLVDQGLVVVTFNYRLGPLGFLSLQNEDVAGNMGLKDQAMALRWVQKNIAAFGGNPKEVTIFGESAGAASVHFLVLSPATKGLFQRAIMESGSALQSWALAKNPRERAFRLGETMGCKTKDDKELYEFLKTAEPRQMVEAIAPSRSKEEKRRMITYTFVPCIEAELSGHDAIVPKDPEVLLKEGKFNRVPLIMGVTSHEGILLLSDIIADPSLMDKIDGDFERLVPENLLPAQKDLMVSRQLSEKIRNFYFGSKSISEQAIDEYVDLQTDLLFTVDMRKALRLHTTVASNVPVYVYQFCVDAGMNFFKHFILQEKYSVKGACHADEIGYLFKLNLIDVSFPPDSLEMRTMRRMTKLWANFAKTGNPTPALDEDVTTFWKPHTETNPSHLKIDSELSKGVEIEKQRLDFWDMLYRTRQGDKRIRQ